jgi:hypothetical protein
MKKKHQLMAASLLATALLPFAARAQVDYEYEQVDFPGAPATQIFGINQPGSAVGNGFGPTAALPFVYDTKQGSFTAVEPAAGFLSTSIVGINNRGDLVGSVVRQSFVTSGYLLDKEGVETVFDHPAALFGTQARSVNSQGLVTGFRDTADDLTIFAGFIYDPASGIFTDVVPSSSTIAQGINSRGDVVGSAVFAPGEEPCVSPDALGIYGWMRTPQGLVSYFTVNGQSTRARGINDAGAVTGFFTDTATGEDLGFVTKLDGTQCQDITISAEELIVFPGAPETFPQGITNSGVVSGNYRDQAGVSHGFIATPQ